MRPSTKRPVVSLIKLEIPPVVEDPDDESILNSKKGGLKANGVQEGSEGVSLFAPSVHVGEKFPLVEYRRRTGTYGEARGRTQQDQSK